MHWRLRRRSICMRGWRGGRVRACLHGIIPVGRWGRLWEGVYEDERLAVCDTTVDLSCREVGMRDRVGLADWLVRQLAELDHCLKAGHAGRGLHKSWLLSTMGRTTHVSHSSPRHGSGNLSSSAWAKQISTHNSHCHSEPCLTSLLADLIAGKWHAYTYADSGQISLAADVHRHDPETCSSMCRAQYQWRIPTTRPA